MSSVKSSSSAGEPGWRDLDRHDGRGGEIIRMGYLKKLKTMRKKFFVLRGESPEASARLEYYDSEKKWRSHHAPKRTIALKTCFNINRRTDTKHRNVIALYTKDDCFCVVLEAEEELEEWLTGLLSLQHGEDVPDGEPPKPTFEHVWQVTVQKKGLGNSQHILGPHLLCLTDKTLSLVSKGQEEKPVTYEFPLMSIRRCGHSDCFFYMEVGRSSCTGAGDLWMQTEDPNIAQNMHAAILSAMSNNSSSKDKDKEKDEVKPGPTRARSSSANEASKPITVNTRKHSHLGTMKTSYYSTSEDMSRPGAHIAFVRAPAAATYAEHPCMSPSTPDCGHTQVCVGSVPGSYHCHHALHRAAPPPHHAPSVGPAALRPSQRRHSVSAMSISSGGGSGTGPGPGPTHHRTYSFPLSEPSQASSSADASRRAATGGPSGSGRTKRCAGCSSSARSSTAAGRERCDSLPARSRTTSEGHPGPAPHIAPTPRAMHLAATARPHSMYSRGISYSPPVGSSPVSPASGACSTDSAGSSLSIDDPGEGGWGEEGPAGLGRYGHSLTPDEPAILEDDDEYAHWPGPGPADSSYLPMDRSQASLSLPISSSTAVSAVSAPHRKISPNLSSSGFKSGSPSQGSYMEMYSPCGSSPMESSGGYMAMSPGVGGSGGALDGSGLSRAGGGGPRSGTGASSVNHSRGSSLAEDGYVPMAPSLTDDGYVDMDPAHPGHGHDHHFPHGEMSPASSCSVTSGTPSTDLRFSEYHLDKVISYFTPSEEDETSSLDRPIRAYSVGSRPESLKKPIRLEGQNQASEAVSRVRAFSVGSRARPGCSPAGFGGPAAAARTGGGRLLAGGATLTPPGPQHLHAAMLAHVVGGKKSSSAPLLSNSWSSVGGSALRHSSEPMDDLMEMDFSRPKGTAAGREGPYVDMAKGKGMGPYVDMRPSAAAASPPSAVGSLSRSPKSLVAAGPFLDVRPGDGSAQPGSAASSPKTSTAEAAGPYLDMRGGRAVAATATTAATAAASPPSAARPTVVTAAGATAACFRPFAPTEEAPYVAMRPALPDGAASAPAGLGFRPSGPGVYMDMRPGDSLPPQHRPTPTPAPASAPAPTPAPAPAPTTTTGSSPQAVAGPYLEMGFAGGRNCGSSSGPGSTGRKPASPIQEEYMEMGPRPGRKLARQESPGLGAVLGPGPIQRTAPLDTPQLKKPPDGYVEMSWGRNSKPSPRSLDDYRSPPSGGSVGHDDYMNMSFEGRSSSGQGGNSGSGSGSSSSRRRERRGSRKEKGRYSSQPIAIGGAGKDTAATTTGKTSSASTSPVFGFLGRKSSSGTPPKVPPAFLPLGGTASSPSSSPFSSLRRSRKVSGGSGGGRAGRRESNDSVGGSGLTTPTGSTTIFPLSLNSPGSPMKPLPGSGSGPGPRAPLLLAAPGSELQEPARKCPVDATSGTVRISYAFPKVPSPGPAAGSPDSSSSSEQPTPVNTEAGVVPGAADYVNLCPRAAADTSDYTPMRPVPVVRPGASEAARKTSAPVFGSAAAGRRLQQGLAQLALSSPALGCDPVPLAVVRPAPCSPLPGVAPLVRPEPSLSRQPSNASSKGSGSSRESRGSHQLSRSSSASSERTAGAGPADESLSARSEDSGTLSPASSQTAVASRPPSVSSERELHYASLDLAPSVSSEGEEGTAAGPGSGARSPRALKGQNSLPDSSNSSPSPNPTAGAGDAFTYAEIDFSRHAGRAKP